VRFVDQFVNQTERYALGTDTVTGTNYLSIPVANTLVDFTEYYALSRSQYDLFYVDPVAATLFADQCRDQLMDQALILKPGRDRGSAR
jgi:hypothetical protein